MVWAVASAAALLYFVTSLTVVVSAFIWLGTWPSFWYALQKVLYWPFQPYFGFTLSALGDKEISYQVYALISRAPFLVVPVLVLIVALPRMRSKGRHHLDDGNWSQTPENNMLGKKTQAILIIAVAAALVALYYSSADVRASVEPVAALVARGDVPGLKEYLLSFGIWAPLVSATLMIVQSIIAPFPAVVITLTNGLLFGAFWGTVLSWSSAMVGAAVCYIIAKALGRPVVERIVGERALKASDSFFDRYGSHAVLIARLIPVISFDLISYAAGLTSIAFVDFMVATGVGQLPATVVYSYLGENISKSTNFALLAFGCLLSLIVVSVAVKKRLERRLPSGQRSIS